MVQKLCTILYPLFIKWYFTSRLKVYSTRDKLFKQESVSIYDSLGKEKKEKEVYKHIYEATKGRITMRYTYVHKGSTTYEYKGLYVEFVIRIVIFMP